VARRDADERDGERGFDTDEEDEYEEDEDEGAEDEEAASESHLVGARRRARHSRHGSQLVSSKTASSWDVFPVPCDPPMPPSFAAASVGPLCQRSLGAVAATCGGGFRAVARTCLLTFHRLSGGRMPVHVAMPLLVLIAAEPRFAQRVSLLTQACWGYGADAPVDVHLAVPSAMPAAVAAAAAAATAWAAQPDTALSIRAPGWDGWEALLPRERDRRGFDEEHRPPRRAALSAHSMWAAQADLCDSLNHRWYEGGSLYAIRPAMGLFPGVPVDVLLGTASSRAPPAGPAAARGSPLRRGGDGAVVRATWDGVAVGPPLCALYDLTSPSEVALVRERLCPACGISCEGNSSTVGRRRLASCLNCFAFWPPPDAPPLLDGWRPSGDVFKKGGLRYCGPCSGCGQLCQFQPIDAADPPPAPGEEDLARCTGCGGVNERRAQMPVAFRGVPGGARAAQPPGWTEPPAPGTKAALGVRPADTRRPAAPGARPGWRPSGNGRWSGDCSDCGTSCEVPFMPLTRRDPPLCRSCLYSDEDDYDDYY
jgi:CxxC-x17-CxxC domain-containing protein